MLFTQGFVKPCARMLKEALERIDLDEQGIFTHSFKRTALSAMSNVGVPLRTTFNLLRSNRNCYCSIRFRFYFNFWLSSSHDNS